LSKATLQLTPELTPKMPVPGREHHAQTWLFGGSSGYGTVFKVDTSHNETVLHNFKGFMNSDGAYPILAGLIRDKAGNLYGTTLAWIIR
jgi:uncharacterized repeat protein (TIGR03803 family)